VHDSDIPAQRNRALIANLGAYFALVPGGFWQSLKLLAEHRLTAI
jgi:hypothetical protein